MKMQKNIQIGLGIVAAGVLLAACGGGSSDSGETGGGETTGGTDSGLTIGVSFYTMQTPLFVEMLQGIEDVAAEQGIEIIFYDAGGSAEQQINQIENLITSEVDAIIASPADATALVPAYQNVQAAGIPIFSAANKVADEYESGFVGPNLSVLAKETMDLLIDCMGGAGEMVLITGPPVISFVQLQQAGWDEALAANPDVSVVQTLVDEDFSTAKAVDLANAALTANPDVAGIMSSTDNIGVGVVQAIKGQGIDPTSICTAGWDAQENAVELVREGTYDITLSFLGWLWGAESLEVAVNAAKGQFPEGHYVDTPTLFVTTDNVADLTTDQILGKVPVS